MRDGPHRGPGARTIGIGGIGRGERNSRHMRSVGPGPHVLGFDQSALGIAMSTVEGTSSRSGRSLSSTTTQPTVTASLFNCGVICNALREILDDIPAFRALVDAGYAGGSTGGSPTSSSVCPSSSGGSVHLKGVSP